MELKERIDLGDRLVANQFKADGVTGLKVGDPFIFCHEDWTVTDICDGDLEGMVWIRKSI